MKIEPTRQIAIRLTRIAVIIAFLLGIVLSSTQIAFDFGEQQSIIDQTIEEVFEVSKDSAQRIVHQLDTKYAEELITGLSNYHFLTSAQIIDDSNMIMSEFNIPIETSWSMLLTKILIGETSEYSYKLQYQGSKFEGTLNLTVNNDLILNSFYNRAVYLFISGLVRNLILALLLLYVFNWMVTKPLTKFAHSFGLIDAKKPSQNRVDYPKGHRHSEIGYIINTVNHFIDSVESFQADLSSVEEQLRIILNTIPLMVYATTEDGSILFANAATSSYYHIDIDQLKKSNLFKLHNTVNRNDTDDLQRYIEATWLSEKENHQHQLPLTNYDGDTEYYEVSFIPLKYFNNRAVLSVFTNITDRINAEQAIRKLAYHDSLTGLPNRVLFQDRLKMDIVRAERFGHLGALLFIDLDKFKLINDTLGHAIGDKVLIEISKKLQTRLRDVDTLARMGGDEFSLSLGNLGREYNGAVSHALQIANEYNQLLNTEIGLSGQGYQISASIGIVMYPFSSNEEAELLRYADAAMYRAKANGRNQVVVFENSMIEQVKMQVEIEKEIYSAIEKDEFTIACQPIYEASNQQPIAAEILIRWQHPEKGLLTPAAFIDSMESLNLMRHISEATTRLCSGLIHKLGIQFCLESKFKFSINISTLEFYEPDFVNRILSSINKHHVPYELFELEITETVALHDIEIAKRKITELQNLGFSFSIDDFGTGYSSLGYLKNLNVQKLKVDRSFVANLEHDVQDQKLVESIIDIANNFNLQTVIEGVETQDQFQWLNRFPNLQYQGFWFNRPMPVDDFIKLMHQKERSPELSREQI